MIDATEQPIATEEYRRGQTEFSEAKDVEQLSQTLRTHVRIAKQASKASLFHRSELAVWLGEQRHLIDEALEFMAAKGWAVKFGAPDAWLIR